MMSLLQLPTEKKTPIRVQLNQIFGSSYFDRALPTYVHHSFAQKHGQTSLFVNFNILDCCLESLQLTLQPNKSMWRNG